MELDSGSTPKQDTAKAPARRRRTEARRRSTPPAAPVGLPDEKGAELERRVGRIEFAEGALVRIRVPIRADAEPGRDVLTDIDVLALDVDRRLRLTRSTHECKSAPGQAGEPDRLLWLHGFKALVGADRATLVRVTASRRGRALAQKLGLEVLDDPTLAAREAAHAWLPGRFAHVGGEDCVAAESRMERQLKGLGHIPRPLVAFLRYQTCLEPPHTVLGALAQLDGAVAAGGLLPEPTATLLAGYALIAVLISAIHHAGRLDTLQSRELGALIENAFATGSPDDDRLLDVLSNADRVVQYEIDKIHAAYQAAGAARVETPVMSLRALVAETPHWLDSYVDLVERLRANTEVASDLLQTAELACFEAMLGGEAWASPAFDHLFTPEHGQLLLVAARTAARIAGDGIGAHLRPLADLPFDRRAPSLPDRRRSNGGPSSSPQLGRDA